MNSTKPENAAAVEPLVISVRQPWAWLLIRPDIIGDEARDAAYNTGLIKDVENRDWPTRVRGLVSIHASKGMTHDEYDDCCEFVSRIISPEIIIPKFDDLERGGIVGSTNIINCVSRSESKWFSGRFGFVSYKPRSEQFKPCRGKLGFFRI